MMRGGNRRWVSNITKWGIALYWFIKIRTKSLACAGMLFLRQLAGSACRQMRSKAALHHHLVMSSMVFVHAKYYLNKRLNCSYILFLETLNMMPRKSNLFHVVYVNLLVLLLVGGMMFSHSYGIQQAKESLPSGKTPYESPIGIPRDPVEKDFNKMREYFSYDPVTNSWSAIEDFKSIKRLDGVFMQPHDPYLYYHFWAYDTKQKKWKRVNIGNYSGNETVANLKSIVEDVTEKSEKQGEKKQGPRSFWSKVGLSCSVGGGALYSYYQAHGLDLYIKKGGPSFYFQIANSADAKDGKGHEIKWPEKRYTRNIKFTPIDAPAHGVVHDNNSISHIKNKGNLYLQSVGMSIPVDLGLHYTFFNKLRVGLGGNFEANYVRTIQLGGDAKGNVAYEPVHRWSYHIKPYGSLAYKCFQREKGEVVLDAKVGTTFDLGTSPWKNLTFWIGGPGFYTGLGVANERRLNDYFKWFYRVGVDLKKYKDDTDFRLYSQTADAFVNTYQASLNLTIGTFLSFGRDIEEEQREASAGDEADDGALAKITQAVESADEKLQQAEEAKQKVQQAKRALSLFKR
eukprot:gene328-419_t